jgi:PAS domain S-box-containing protein
LDWLAQLVKETPIREGWVTAAYAIDGQSIALQPDPGNSSPQAVAGELISFIQTRPPETVRILTGPDGVRRIYGIAPLAIAHGDLYLVIGAPPDVAFSEIEGQFRRALLVSILVAVVSFVLAWIVIQRQLFDFSGALRGAFDDMSKGDRSVRAPVSAISEFQLIADGFNRMAGELEVLEQRHASDQQRVRESTALLDAVMNSGEALVYIFDLEGRCLLANQAFARLLGASPDAMRGVSRDTLVSSERAQALRADDRRVLDGGASIRVEESFHEVVDGERNFLSFKFPLRNTAGKIYAIGEISSDITEKIRSEIALSLAAMVFETSAEGIFITDRDQRILQVNPRFTAITGYTAAEAIGQTPRLLRSGVQDRDFYPHLWARLQRTGAWEGEITNRRKDGSLYAEWLSISTVKTANGTVQNYIGLFSDLTQKQALDRRVDELQNFDPLTGLPNRNLFIDRVQHSVRTASREKRGMAVFWVDIARFRVINDTFGHPIGDSVRIEVGQRLQHVVRAADSITRLSADEFGVLMFGFDRIRHASINGSG